MSKVTDNIEKLMNEKGICASTMCEAAHIAKSCYSQWKSGKSLPTNTSLKKIADFFGVTPEALISGLDEKQKPKAEHKPQQLELTVSYERESTYEVLASLPDGMMLDDVVHYCQKSKKPEEVSKISSILKKHIDMCSAAYYAILTKSEYTNIIKENRRSEKWNS